FGTHVPGGTDTWVLQHGAWRQLAANPGTQAASIAYDPVRDAFVVCSTDEATWLLKDELWLNLIPPFTDGQTGTVSAVTYDPHRGGVVAVDPVATWLLPSDGTSWIGIGPPPPPLSANTIAIDPRSDDIVAIGVTPVEL